MSYPTALSYSHSSSDDSFSYISDLTTVYYCSVYNPPSSLCPIHHNSYPYYYTICISHQEQVSHSISTSTALLQVHSKKSQRFSSAQIRILEEHFYKGVKHLSKVTINELSTRIQLKPAQIRVWFTNKHTREHC